HIHHQDSIYHKLHKQIVPGFSATTFATCKKITMAFQDEGGNSVSLTILEYYSALLQGAVTFLEDKSLQYNLANHFLRQLQKYLLITTCCEKKLLQTKDFVKQTIGDTHSFMGKFVCALGVEIPVDTLGSQTFLSTTKKTLQLCKDEKRTSHQELLPPTNECWGCKEIIFPNKNACGVANCVALMHKEYIKDLHSRHKGWVLNDKIKFSQLLPSQNEVGCQYFLRQAQSPSSAASIMTGTVSSLSSATPYHSHGRAYVVLPIMHSTDAQHERKPILPVQIDDQLPHITLVLGSMDRALENCPIVCCIFDTGTCLSSGYTGFWLPILKAHPECITDLTPLIMANALTLCLVELSQVLCYKTTTHQPITHTIAIGSYIGVNTILGNTFINDSSSGVVDAKLLNVEPSPLTDMFLQCYESAEKGTCPAGQSTKNYSSIASILDELSTSMLIPAHPITTQCNGVDNNPILRKRPCDMYGTNIVPTGYSTYLSDVPDDLQLTSCANTSRTQEEGT
ncbi:hypothetical protein HJC23_005471, partial [Cyclotella cryptica]